MKEQKTKALLLDFGGDNPLTILEKDSQFELAELKKAVGANAIDIVEYDGIDIVIDDEGIYNAPYDYDEDKGLQQLIKLKDDRVLFGKILVFGKNNKGDLTSFKGDPKEWVAKNIKTVVFKTTKEIEDMFV